jgi:hypothetical protein
MFSQFNVATCHVSDLQSPHHGDGVFHSTDFTCLFLLQMVRSVSLRDVDLSAPDELRCARCRVFLHSQPFRLIRHRGDLGGGDMTAIAVHFELVRGTETKYAPTIPYLNSFDVHRVIRGTKYI